MDRKKCLNQLMVMYNVFAKAQGNDSKEAIALEKAIKSLNLWGTFIEKLADRCNSATVFKEWDISRKSIELIKDELEEAIN